jgi:hypothetical protein
MTIKPRENQVTTLKRKVGYLDETLSVTKAKMSRMEIDIRQQRDKASEFIQGSAAEKSTE